MGKKILKNVWLKANSIKALLKARANMLNFNPSLSYTDNDVIFNALDLYNKSVEKSKQVVTDGHTKIK